MYIVFFWYKENREAPSERIVLKIHKTKDSANESLYSIENPAEKKRKRDKVVGKQPQKKKKKNEHESSLLSFSVKDLSFGNASDGKYQIFGV